MFSISLLRVAEKNKVCLIFGKFAEINFISGINPVSSTQLENLLIAEVTQTSEYSSELRIVEGSRQDLYSLSAVPF